MAEEEEKKSLWRKVGRRLGKAPDYSDPELLWAACVRYFRWNEANPLETVKLMVVDNQIRRPKVRHPRPMTIQAMCAYIGTSRRAWQNWRSREDLQEVIDRVEAIIFAQKFEHAAIGQFNAALIARELGLADKQELSGPDGGPVELINSGMSPAEAAEMYARTRQQG